LPQGLLEDALHQAVRGAGVSLLTPVEASVIQQEDNEVRVRAVRRELVTLGSPAEYSEWQPIESFVIKARYVIGADGYESRVRAALGIDVAAIGPTESFAMFEGPTSTTLEPRLDLGYAGQLFSNTLTVAPNRARLGFQIATGLDATADMARLRELSPERAPWFHYAACTGVDWGAVTHFERRLVRRFGHGRVWLAGDAAHVTNPFGAQSMNIGLSEAAALVDRIHAGSRRGDATDSLRDYGLCCQREWYRLFGYHVKFELLPHAPEWLGSCARKLLPVLPVSGADLNAVLQELGLVLD
jgi:2-polyprenyl-6-methoxyphenol hydroxylase-like FAD-dependent oxidoreductase